MQSLLLLTCLATDTFAFSCIPLTNHHKPLLNELGRHALVSLRPRSFVYVNRYSRKHLSEFRNTLLKAEDHPKSSKISIREKIDYFVERLLSKGTLTQVLVLVFISSLIVAFGALLIWIAALGSGSVEYAISKSYLLLFRCVCLLTIL
jgi:hypothetical protein